jgi:non-ribosomal peptide synthetase component F
LPELPIQVVDYAVWQRRRFPESVLEQHRQYWRDQLGTAPRAIALPFDRPWDGQNVAARLNVCFDGERHARLVASAAQAGGIFFTLWSAFVATLHAWTGARDMVVGTWRAHRDRAETEQLIGSFVNFMALRMRVREKETFSQLRTRIRNELLDAFQYSELSYGEVIRTLEVPQTPGLNPLCNVAFQMARTSLDGPSGPTQIAFAGLPIPQTTVRVNIFVETFVSSESVTFGFVYNASLFDQSTIESLARLYFRVVEQFSDDPDREVGAVD